MVACCIWPCFLDDGLLPAIVCLGALAIILLILLSVYYRIDGDRLVVYSFFVPHSYPISKIKSVMKTKSILSAPATSFTHRLAVTFTDRKILRSCMPLLISPVRPEEFIRQLREINPDILSDC